MNEELGKIQNSEIEREAGERWCCADFLIVSNVSCEQIRVAI